MFSKCKQIILGCILSLTVVFSASAQVGTHMGEIEAATRALQQAAQAGPRQISLTNQAVLNLPASYYFIPKTEAARYQRAIGNRVDPTFLGMVISDHMNGFVFIEFIKSGYIKDDDARNWDTDELLKDIKEGTEYDNKDRVRRGLPALEVTGWIEKPFYEAATHQLISSLGLRDKSTSTKEEELVVNYNTYLLGREGYISMDLVTDSSFVDAEKPLVKTLLAATEFKQGKRYQDFDGKTDHVAEYGLAALVGGVAAKKLGLLALVAAFLVKFWKLLLIGIFAFGAIIRGVLKKKKSVDLSK